MEIRTASPEDVNEVKAIIGALQVTRQQKDWEQADCGLFEYPKSRQELLQSLNPYFLVAQTREGIRGFSLAYDSDFFRNQFGNTNHQECRFILDNIKAKFLYVDQFGVLDPSSLGAGRIINSMYDREVELARQAGLQKIIAYACQKPILNRRSDNFLIKKGFRKTVNVPIENGIVLALYELQL